MYPQVAVTTLWMVAVFQTASCLDCGPDQHDLNGLRCCTKCAPGFGVKTPCNRVNDTVCAPCRRGEMFSPVDSHQDECRPCKTCPQYSHVKKMCNQSHDTQCECDHNYYFDSVSNSCRMCENCVMGFGAKRQCDKNRNTVCSQCPPGTFSDVISYDACKICTSCKSNQLMLSSCDTSHNTICVDMPESPIESTVGVSTTELVEAEEEAQSTQDKLIPVYCAILALVILVLIIYVVVKQVQYRRNPPNNKKNVSYLAVGDPANNGPADINTSATMQVVANTRNQGSDSGVSLEHDSRPLSNNTRLREVPGVKLKAVEQMLHSSPHWRGGWTSFAREIGYNNAKISQFENKASQTGRMPAEVLLAEWSKSDATVEVLVRTLKNCDRDDIVSVLYSDTRSQAFLHNHPQLQGVTNGHVGAQNNPAIMPQCNPQNGPTRSVGGSLVNYGNIGHHPGPQGHMGQGQMNVVQGHPVQTNLGQGHQHYMNVGQGQQVLNNMGQGQMGVGQGHSSVSGSSTTDLSGTGGPRYISTPSSGGFQHIVPSYHSLQSGQQMV